MKSKHSSSWLDPSSENRQLERDNTIFSGERIPVRHQTGVIELDKADEIKLGSGIWDDIRSLFKSVQVLTNKIHNEFQELSSSLAAHHSDSSCSLKGKETPLEYPNFGECTPEGKQPRLTRIIGSMTGQEPRLPNNYSFKNIFSAQVVANQSQEKKEKIVSEIKEVLSSNGMDANCSKIS